MQFNIIRKDFKECSAFNCFELVSHMKKELLINYMLSHFRHFNEEKYLNSKIMHKKIMYDIQQIEIFFPIKYSKSNIKDEIFIDKIKDCLFKWDHYETLINSTSEEIFNIIKETLGNHLYDYLILKRENEMKKLINEKLSKITEHISCFYVYEYFYLEYLQNNLI